MSKIFISYKYADSNVKSIDGDSTSTPRDYVDKIQDKIGKEHINKGEKDEDDMSSLEDSTIQSKLGDRIYDSSVTIVLISPNMKNNEIPENEQWIPWEISYSLREQSRKNRTSKSNAMLAVVLPDVNGSYEYFIEKCTCKVCKQNCIITIYQTDSLFEIIRSNMFNRKNPNYICDNEQNDPKPQSDDHSYIYVVRWDDFILDYAKYINKVNHIKENIAEYNIKKNL